MLYQASNITPSTLAGMGSGVIDATQSWSIKWQINGTSPIKAYKIDLYSNATDKKIATTNMVTLENPIYPVDANGNPQLVVVEISRAQNPFTFIEGEDIRNGEAYRFLITQWWDVENDQKIVESVENVFYAKSTPTVVLSIEGLNNNIVSSRIISATGTYSQTQNVPISEAVWTLYKKQSGLWVEIDKKTVINTQLLQYKYETLFSGDNYKIQLEIYNADGIYITTQKEFVSEYSSSLVLENIKVEKTLGNTANKITWEGTTSINGVAEGDVCNIPNEPNWGENCVGIGITRETQVATGSTTFALSKTYNTTVNNIQVYVNGERIYDNYGKKFDDNTQTYHNYSVVNNSVVFNTAPANGSNVEFVYSTATTSKIVFSKVNDDDMYKANFTADNNIIWQGTIEDDTPRILATFLGEYVDNLNVRVGDCKIELVIENKPTTNDKELAVYINDTKVVAIGCVKNTYQQLGYKYVWYAIAVTGTNNSINNGKRVAYICRYDMSFPLYPNGVLFANDETFAKNGEIATERKSGVYSGWNTSLNTRMTSLTLNGGQWCDFLRMDTMIITDNIIDEIMPEKTKIEDFDLYEQKRFASNYFLANFGENDEGNIDLRAGDNSGAVFQGSLVVRETEGAAERKIITTVSTDELGELYDFGIKSGEKYKYFIYPQGADALGDALETADYVGSQFDGYSLIVAKHRADIEPNKSDSNFDNQYIVQKEYLFKHNSSIGAVSNNTKVSYFENFTRYPKVLVGTSNYKSGTLSGLIGSVKWVKTQNKEKQTYQKYQPYKFAEKFNVVPAEERTEDDLEFVGPPLNEWVKTKSLYPVNIDRYINVTSSTWDNPTIIGEGEGIFNYELMTKYEGKAFVSYIPEYNKPTDTPDYNVIETTNDFITLQYSNFQVRFNKSTDNVEAIYTRNPGGTPYDIDIVSNTINPYFTYICKLQNKLFTKGKLFTMLTDNKHCEMIDNSDDINCSFGSNIGYYDYIGEGYAYIGAYTPYDHLKYDLFVEKELPRYRYASGEVIQENIENSKYCFKNATTGKTIYPKAGTAYYAPAYPRGIGYNKAYCWSYFIGNGGEKYYGWNSCGELKTFTKYTKEKGKYCYQDKLQTSEDIMNLATEPNNHYFLKDMKGFMYKVDISSPMSRTINYKASSMPITMEIKWTEIGNADDIALFSRNEV